MAAIAASQAPPPGSMTQAGLRSPSSTSTSNPQGAVASADYWRDLIALAEKHDFRVFADECYSEVYRDAAPVGAMQVAAEMGENRVLYDQLRRDLDDIDKALERMDEGTYGTCEVCGKDIGEARLEIMPSTRVCIDHA